METKNIKQVFEEAGYEIRSYSGRAMYGRECLGVDTEDSPWTVATNCITTCVALEIDFDDFIDSVGKPRTDSMGRGYILYFPDVVWEDE